MFRQKGGHHIGQITQESKPTASVPNLLAGKKKKKRENEKWVEIPHVCVSAKGAEKKGL